MKGDNHKKYDEILKSIQVWILEYCEAFNNVEALQAKLKLIPDRTTQACKDAQEEIKKLSLKD